MMQRAAVPIVVSQHLEDAAALRSVRSVLVRAPHVKLLQLGRTDERLRAHLDGLSVAGAEGAAMARQALATPGTGQVFTCAVLAIERRDTAQLERLLALAESVPEATGALESAFGWVTPALLRGLTAPLLQSESPAARRLGIAACALQRVDPGDLLTQACASTAPGLLERAMRTAGQLGRVDLLSACQAALQAPQPGVRLAAASSALLLGNRDAAVHALAAMAHATGPEHRTALVRVVKVLSPEAVHGLLRPLAQAPGTIRTLIRGVGAAGDPHYIPWLVQQMADPRLTRLAGEAFSTITGLDLAYLDLDRKPPDDAAVGPNDDPADAEVALDEDESLPWPDVDRIGAWWRANGARFMPGQRYFMGAPPSVAHCVSVLKTGFQRQRIAAAEYLCLLQPGTPLFNAAAPSWRQQRLLAQMTGA